jgi:hypothetical protein
MLSSTSPLLRADARRSLPLTIPAASSAIVFLLRSILLCLINLDIVKIHHDLYIVKNRNDNLMFPAAHGCLAYANAEPFDDQRGNTRRNVSAVTRGKTVRCCPARSPIDEERRQPVHR